MSVNFFLAEKPEKEEMIIAVTPIIIAGRNTFVFEFICRKR